MTPSSQGAPPAARFATVPRPAPTSNAAIILRWDTMRVHRYRDSEHAAEIDACEPKAEICLGLFRQVAPPPQSSLVVLVALRRVGENHVRFGDLAEVLDRLRFRIDVRMKRAGKLPVDCLDVGGGRVVGYTQHVVKVASRHTDKIGVVWRSVSRGHFRIVGKRTDPKASAAFPVTPGGAPPAADAARADLADAREPVAEAEERRCASDCAAD